MYRCRCIAGPALLCHLLSAPVHSLTTSPYDTPSPHPLTTPPHHIPSPHPLTASPHHIPSGGATLSFEESRAAGELCELARSGDLEKVKLLLSGGCEPDSCDYDRRTCLHLASSVGNHHIVQAV